MLYFPFLNYLKSQSEIEIKANPAGIINAYARAIPFTIGVNIL
jgi:hypothetical protein